MNDLNDMMVFATVVEKGSFTAAAETLHTPKSNISRKVTRLEQYLGVRLLERSTRSQSLTEVGQRYYRYCQRIKEDILAAETAVESLIEKPQGQLKLCSSVSIGQSLLSKHLGEFCQQYPDISLDIALTNRRVDLIEEGLRCRCSCRKTTRLRTSSQTTVLINTPVVCIACLFTRRYSYTR